MADVVGSAAPRPRVIRHGTARNSVARFKRRRDDLWIASTALVAAMLALPLAQSSWHGPEVASVLAVSATAMLAGQRWAIALVVICELLLIPTVLPRTFAVSGDFTVGLAALISMIALVPGVLAMRRAAAALVLITGYRRTPQTIRRFQLGLVASGVLGLIVPMVS
jgi:hypothetical protein